MFKKLAIIAFHWLFKYLTLCVYGFCDRPNKLEKCWRAVVAARSGQRSPPMQSPTTFKQLSWRCLVALSQHHRTRFVAKSCVCKLRRDELGGHGG